MASKRELVVACAISMAVTACTGSGTASDGHRSSDAPVCQYVTLEVARRMLGPQASADPRIPRDRGCYYSAKGNRKATPDGFVQSNEVLAVKAMRRHAGASAATPGTPVKIPGVASPGTWSELRIPGFEQSLEAGSLVFSTARQSIRVTVIGTTHGLESATQVATDVARAKA